MQPATCSLAGGCHLRRAPLRRLGVNLGVGEVDAHAAQPLAAQRALVAHGLEGGGEQLADRVNALLVTRDKSD